MGLYYILSLLASDAYLFAGTGTGQVFRSTDNGSSWVAAGSGLLYTTYNALAVIPRAGGGTNLFTGTYWDSSGVFLSTDNGVNWNQFNDGLTNLNVWTFAISGTNLFAGTGDINGGGACLSTNGSDWIAINEGFPFAFPVITLSISGDYIFAGTLNGVWRRLLSDFIPVELTSFSAKAVDDNIELAWTTSTETNNGGFEVQRSIDVEFETIGFVEGHGTTTESQAYSYLDKNVVTGKYQYRLKQIDYDGTFKYSNVVEVEVTSPSTFSLEQNYPNPFNPSTTIRYAIPEASFVVIKIYDLLGKEVATLVNEEQSIGSYEVEFDAAGLSSGMYFYKLQTDNPSKNSGQGFIETKKMILTK